MYRRTFLAAASSATVANSMLAANDQRRRVAVIGHTGRGDYGHGWGLMQIDDRSHYSMVRAPTADEPFEYGSAVNLVDNFL